MCGDMDSVAVATLSKDGTHVVGYECADVMTGFDVHLFGQGMVVRTDNEHVGYHTWLDCIQGASCHGSYYESTNPMREILVTRSALAVYYDELGDDFGTVGHCVDVIRASTDAKNVECARPRSRRLEWGDDGPAMVIESKSGDIHLLPFVAGESLPVDMLVRALAKKIPVGQAVWTGSTIAAIWSSGKSLKVKMVGRGDLSPGASST
jgi:hypothetical protein